jgi:hypothetical protein
MIEKIEENLEGKVLTVKVTCSIRKFAVHPIKVLTTEQLVDILKEKHKIAKVLETPKKTVGNTKRRKMSDSGVWVFELDASKTRARTTKKQEDKIEKPKEPEPTSDEPLPISESDPEFQPKPDTSSSTKKRTSRSKRSIRGRLTNIANKKD